MKTRVFIPLLAAAALAGVPARCLRAQDTAFTYQGRLTDSGALARGIYDLQFTIYALAGGGLPLGGAVTNSPVAVTNGLLVTTLDFGAGVFNGSPRWLEIGVRSNGSASTFTVLSPRHLLTTTPYSLVARDISGTVGSASLAGTYASPVTISNAANSFAGNFSGNGSGLTMLNASQLTSGTVPDGRLSGNVALLNTDARFNGRVEAVGDLKGWRLNVGTNHLLSGEFSTVAGGAQNLNQGYAASIGGGQLNSIQTNANFATIGGGQLNVIQSNSFFATIGGGREHVIEGGLNSQDNTIGGGRDHAIRRDTQYGTVSGGVQNIIQDGGDYGTIAGGGANIIRSNSSFGSIGGGTANRIDPSTRYATIAGGRNNVLGADYSFVVGSANLIQSNAHYSTISGGATNSIGTNAPYAVIGGGTDNFANGLAATISGGKSNISSEFFATVGGGYYNSASADYAIVSGGRNNSSSKNYATVGGGINNVAGDFYATIAGGSGNTVSDDYAAIGGGYSNFADGQYSAIPGGYNNATASYASFAMGANNVASGDYSTALGFVTTASGTYSAAMGQRAKALHNGSFVWADSQTADFASTAEEQFCIRAAGGVHLISSGDVSPASGGHFVCGPVNDLNLALDANEIMARNNGVASSLFLNASGGNVSIGTSSATHRLRVVNATCDGATWNNASDRALKDNLRPVDVNEILEHVVALPIHRWNYKSDPDSAHLGPVAQDFHSTFGLGADDKHIATVDADGVALAAIQGLNQKLEVQRAENTELKRRLAGLEQRLLEFTREAK